MTAELAAAQRSRLMSEVATARRDGYSVVRPQSLPFVVAAPVFDDTGLRATATALSDVLGAPKEARSGAGV